MTLCWHKNIVQPEVDYMTYTRLRQITHIHRFIAGVDMMSFMNFHCLYQYMNRFSALLSLDRLEDGSFFLLTQDRLSGYAQTA